MADEPVNLPPTPSPRNPPKIRPSGALTLRPRARTTRSRPMKPPTARRRTARKSPSSRAS